MPDSFPYHGQSAGNCQLEEETLQDNGEVLQVIAIHVDARQRADHAARCGKQHPVPLPSSPNNSKSLILAQMLFSMLMQIDQGEHDGHTKHGTKCNTRNASCLDPVVWYVASCPIDPTAIAEHRRFVVVEYEIAFRVV
jgi:hypothetical protein